MTWRNLVLGDSLELLIDNRGKNPPFEKSGIPAISGMSVKPGRIELSEARRVSEDTWKKWMPEPTRRDDLILTSEAPLGRVALLRDDSPVLVAQRVYCLRGQRGVLDSKFLYYAFQTDAVQADLSGRASGTTVLGIRQPELRKVVIPAPNYDEQRAIAEVLGALDDKIAANNQIVELSAQLSASIWHQRTTGSERSTPLSSLAEFVNGRAYTKNASGTGRVVIRIAELNSGVTGSTVLNDIEVPANNVANPGDLLFAWSGSLTVARWYRDEAIVNQHIFKVIPKADNPIWVVDQSVRSLLENFKSIAADRATTMGHIQRKHLDQPVTIPSASDVNEISPLLSSLWDRALSAERETLSLAKTRDELLPLLMSGKLRVKDAEKKVEAIA